jgi:hypothetical protein
MSIYGGPDIETDGLVLHLDAANRKSFPGTGSSWKDLSGRGRNFTLVNSPSFSTARKGKFILSGSNDYFSLSESIVAGKDEFTWQAFVKFHNMQPAKASPYYQLYIEESQLWIAQYKNAVGIDLRQSDNTWFDGSGGDARGAQIGEDSICRNVWYHFAWTFNRYGNGGTSGQVKGYLNGELVTTANTNKTGPIKNNGTLPEIGRRGASNQNFDGEISKVSFYDRQLSDKEIKDNYNALKGRYPEEDLSDYENVTYTTDNSGNIYISNNGGKNVDMFRIGSTGWNRQFYSTTSFTAPCTIEYRKNAAASNNGQSYAMISWNVDPTSNSSYNTLDYAAYPYQQNSFVLYNNGAGITPSKTWNANEKLYIVYNTDGTLKHYNGSSLLYSVNYGTGKTVYVDTSLYSNNNVYGGFYSVRVRKQAWNGTAYV